jgi:hypothetical protein
MEEAMIQAQVMAARVACARMTALHLSALHDSVERASCLVAGSQWDRKATAHAEIFDLLADAADDPTLAPLLKGGAAYVRELMLAVGRAADGDRQLAAAAVGAHAGRGLGGRSAGDRRAPQVPALHVAPGTPPTRRGRTQRPRDFTANQGRRRIHLTRRPIETVSVPYSSVPSSEPDGADSKTCGTRRSI